MTWTRGQPTTTGWYWKRNTQFRIVEIVQVRRYAGKLAVHNTHLDSCIFFHTEWAGPIPEPNEASP